MNPRALAALLVLAALAGAGWLALAPTEGGPAAGESRDGEPPGGSSAAGASEPDGIDPAVRAPADGEPRERVAPSAVPRGTLFIRGVVLDGDHGRAVPRALLTLSNPRDLVVGEAASAGDGAFAIELEAPPGPYFLRAECPGFVPLREDVELELGAEDLKGVRVEMLPVKVLRGRVFDAEHRGVAASIELFSARGSLAGIECAPDGTFSVNAIERELDLRGSRPDSRVLVVARSASHRPAQALLTFDEIERETPVEILVARGARIAGRVVDRAGAPIAGVALRVRPDGDAADGEMRDVVSGSDGAFVFGGLDAGTWRVEPQPSVEPDLAPRRRSVAIELAQDGEHLGLEIAYDRGLPIRGRVTAAKDERAVPGRLLTLHHPEWSGALEAYSGDDGAFEFPAVTEGEYVVALRGESWEDGRPPVEQDAKAGGDGVVFRVDEEPEDGELRLALVDAATGSPLPGGTEAELTLAFERFGAPKRLEIPAALDATGSIVLLDLARGAYRFALRTGGYARALGGFEIAGEDATRPPPVKLEVNLLAPIELRGRVLDSDNHPVAGARVTAFGPGGDLEAWDLESSDQSDRTGAFVIEGAPPDASLLCCAAAGYAPQCIEIDRREPGWTLVLSRGARVDGIARFAGGRPARLVPLSLDGAVGRHRSTTDLDGRFRFEDVEDGGFTLMLQDGTSLGDGRIEDSADLEIEIELPSGN